MNILITGAAGMLGHDVVAALAGSHSLTAVDIAELDITDASRTLQAVSDLAPHAVINCAAYTNVDGCETDVDAAYAVNADGPANLARACRQAGARLVHISTDYVFDGTGKRPWVEQDTTNPLSVYGTSKLAGEKHIQEILAEHVIIRTEWLYGRHGKHFVATMLRLASEREFLEVVDDQTGSPTSTADLARAIAALLTVPSRGIYHVTNSGSCSWFGFTQKILSLVHSPTPVRPITSERLARPARRPAYSVLDCSRFTKETGHVLRPWEQALEDYLRGAPAP